MTILRSSILLLALTIPAISSAGPLDNPDPKEIVSATLIADSTSVQPDSPLTLGVLYKIKAGWHIYWKNPGDSGLATTIALSADGQPLKTETLYPAPMTFEMPGEIFCFGYENEVLLMAKIDTKQFEGKSTVQFTAHTSWLMCSDRCIPGKADLILSLPVKKGEKFNASLFDHYTSLSPITGPPASAKVSSAINGESLSISIACDNVVCGQDKLPDYQKAYFYPFAYDALDVSIPIASKPDKTIATKSGEISAYEKPFTIECKAKNRDNSKAPIKIGGVLVLPVFLGGNDKPTVRAYEITIP